MYVIELAETVSILLFRICMYYMYGGGLLKVHRRGGGALWAFNSISPSPSSFPSSSLGILQAFKRPPAVHTQWLLRQPRTRMSSAAVCL